jgi:hypothetical protein
MWLYLIIFIIPTIAYFYEEKSIRGNKGLEHSVWFLAIFMFGLCIFVGISDMLGGYDRYIYGSLFDDAADHLAVKDIMNSQIFNQYPKEIGYDFLNVFIAIFTSNRYIYIFIVTIIIYTLTFISFKRYMTNYPYATILFISLIFFFTFTYLRQILAVSIAWLSINYIVERKFWKYLSIIIIAYLFHNSAIILFPFYFLPTRKFKMRNILIVMGLCLFLGASGVTNGFYQAFGFLSGSEDRQAVNADESGFRVAYMIEAAFFLYFILANYKAIPNEKMRLVLCNMALTFCGILLFFIKSENGGRLSWYYMIGLIATLTYILTYKKREYTKSLLLMVVSFYLFFRIVYNWNFMLYPYKTFFTNGYRQNDMTHEIFEYDDYYDKDKFYR